MWQTVKVKASWKDLHAFLPQGRNLPRQDSAHHPRHRQIREDREAKKKKKQGGINRKGRYERRRNERRRREREEEFLHVETGSRALHH